jgi:hypothetical protein
MSFEGHRLTKKYRKEVNEVADAIKESIDDNFTLYDVPSSALNDEDSMEALSQWYADVMEALKERL